MVSLISFFILVVFFSILSNFSVSFSIFLFKKDFFNLNFLNLGFSHYDLIFFLMVFLVTSLVSVYSEVYMDNYNNFKFFFLMFSFFFSMSALISSHSPLFLMISWDFLGLTSLFLVLFYPNNLSGFNSYITMIFNRLGDILMILILVQFILIPSNFFFITDKLIFPLFLLCSLTKSAQFPLSSWLPAAMSAPTPISAMVHSSTLVTAGILLNFKMMSFYYDHNLMEYLFFFSFTSFLTGGILSCLELDLKKVVAFSTLSQISMIMLFISLNQKDLGFLHMIFHAFFKTTLFVVCGLVFFFFLNSQSLKKFFKLSFDVSFFFFFLSIFLMSGLIFSSSFFSKDLFLENLIFNSSFLFNFILLGSILTSFYCGKMLDICLSKMSKQFIFYSKMVIHWWMLIFSILILFSSFSLQNLFFLDKLMLISMSDCLFLFLVILFPFIIPSLNSKKHFILNSMMDLFFMKSFSFSLLSKNKKILIDFFNDMFMNKPEIFKFFQFQKNYYYYHSSNFFLLILIFL